ncbi:unnamed protein product, partial [Heligmosomoides polygyrus]
IGVATNVILSWLGPEAVNRWNIARDLIEVAAPSASIDSPLGANFRPMLLARLPKDGWWELKENCGEEFFVETKYDGEHVLLHKISCDEYKWYTRNGKDFTKDYGGSSSLTDLVSGRIHSMFRSSVKDCILDCELMLWDKKLKKLWLLSITTDKRNIQGVFLEFVLSISAVVVFDLLYLNGKSIMNAPLYQRLRALDAGVLKDNHGHVDIISIAPRKTIHTKWVVEMTAAGIRDGKFIDPVMRRIRHDKDVEEVDTMATFREYEQVSLVALDSKLSDKSPAKEKPKRITKRMIAEASERSFQRV